MTEDEFWIATPAETDRRQWAYIERKKDEERSAIRLAHLQESWRRSKRVPTLSKVFADIDGPQVLSEEEQKALQDDHARLIRELGSR